MTEQHTKDIIEDTSAIEARYKRAQSIMQGFTTQSLVQNDDIYPSWIEGTNSFWYQRTFITTQCPSVEIGKQYRLVDAKAKTNEIAFDHNTFASALAHASNQDVDPCKLPITQVNISLSPLMVIFTAFDKYWQYDEGAKTCHKIPSYIVESHEVCSPDSRLLAFTRDFNLWVRDRFSGEEKALTADGELDFAYASSTAWGMDLLPDVPALWSPDSSRLLVVQRDKRSVEALPMVNHVPSGRSILPTLEKIKVAYPGDENIEKYRVLAIDVLSGTLCSADYQPIPTSSSDYFGFYDKLIWWGEDSRTGYFIDQERGDKVVRLIKFDTNTGHTKVLFEETSDTHVNITPDLMSGPLHRPLHRSNELIWWSERDGWGHLYLYDLNNGKLKHPITSGNWRVREVLLVDETRRELVIQTSGRMANIDPYYRDICRINIDTGELTTIFGDDVDFLVHQQNSALVKIERSLGKAGPNTMGIAPSGDFIVITRTRADQVPVTLLCDKDGNQILELEVASTTNLPQNWHWPEPFKVLAADSHTDIYGLLFRPSGFSPDTCYPVINLIGSGPWLSVVPKGSFHSAGMYCNMYYFYAAAIAELGFIVVLLDSRGTPLRSKAFQDDSYGWIPASGNTEDHAGAIRQLAERYNYMDMSRVGVFTRGYRSGLQNFLERQDLYKVCVTMNLFDNRLIGSAVEGDKWESCDGPITQEYYPENLVENLQGKLFLMHGMTGLVIPSYPPAATLRLVEALQKANKKFDLLIVPDCGYMFTNYMTRRAWDYLVRHLAGDAPPKEFALEGVRVSV